MDNDQIGKIVKELNDEFDDYQSSVTGLFAFAYSVLFDDKNRNFYKNSYFKIPAKVIDVNRKQANKTPDSLIVVKSKNPVIAEMKKHFNELKGEKIFSQIKNYDMDLVDVWDNNNISNQDLVLITHQVSSRKAVDYYKEWLKRDGFNNNFAIVSYNLSTTGGGTGLFLELRYGKLSDKNHHEKLYQGKQIQEEIYVKDIIPNKFYDDKPPLIYLLVIINEFFLPLKFDDSIETQKTQSCVVTAEEVREYLQNNHIQRSFNKQMNNIPQLDWVLEALDKFVELGLGQKQDPKSKKYLLSAPSRKKIDAFTFFAKKMIQLDTKKNKSNKRVDSAQQNLFSN